MQTITRVRIANKKVFMGKGVKELLDAVEEHKSIKKATETTGISYPKAMRMIQTLEEELGFSVVASEKGGRNHGGTTLTKKGKEMLECYREIESEVANYARELVDKKFPK